MGRNIQKAVRWHPDCSQASEGFQKAFRTLSGDSQMAFKWLLEDPFRAFRKHTECSQKNSEGFRKALRGFSEGSRIAFGGLSDGFHMVLKMFSEGSQRASRRTSANSQIVLSMVQTVF